MSNRDRLLLYLSALLAANLALLLPVASPLRVTGALLLIGLLPGLGWASRLLPQAPPLLRWSTGAALGYTITALGTLLLHYLPGPIHPWHLPALLNGSALLWLLLPAPPPEPGSSPPLRALLPLLLILLLALLLRTANLHYSEFQGDEALAMLAAAESLEGHPESLFIRSKGPAEVLLPMALWRLSGTINEPIARLPFALAALLACLAIYLAANSLGSGSRAATLFFALNGLMVAFGRIVQYQALVVWLSSLAFVLAMQWRQSGRQRYALLGGLCLGTGLLAHYDAILVIPAIGWLLVGPGKKSWSHSLKAGALLLMGLLAVALPFYLPFVLNPQANRTGQYVGQRIGTELRNNLPDFFHFNLFYNSAYYLIPTGLLILALLAWWVWRSGRAWRLPLLGLALVGIAVVIYRPTLLAAGPLNLALLPFGLLLAGAFLLPPPADDHPPVYRQALIAWLAVPFLGYNFVVALGLTHIYTTVPAWALLAGLAWHSFIDRPAPPRLASLLLGGWAIIITLFLGHAFIRPDGAYRYDYPAANLPLYWTPYRTPPQAGLFGFPHRTGWKAVGQQIATGHLSGDYSSNEEPDVTTWYTRAAPRACDPYPEFYFLAAQLVDPVPVPADVVAADYAKIGLVPLPHRGQMEIRQRIPASLDLGRLDEPALALAFDRSATPANFARSASQALPIEANFGHLVRLAGYELDTQRAYPGGRLPVILYWHVLAPLPASYQVFVHLAGEGGPVAQADGVPVCWSYPTDHWQPGQLITDPHAVPIPPEAAPGQYPLQVGLYLADTFERLEVIDQAGNPAGTSVTLTTVVIKPRE